MRPGTKTFTAALSLHATALLLAAGCGGDPASRTVDPAEHRAEIEAWRQDRVARLTADDGWLTLAGLFWLRPGSQRFGSAPTNDLVFPEKADPELGRLYLEDDGVRLEAEAEILHQGEPVRQLRLASDADGEPTLLTRRDLSFHVIRRDDRFGLRLKDRNHPARAAFRGIDYYEIDPAWCLAARFEPFDPPRELTVPTIQGTDSKQPSFGRVVFETAGGEHSLDALGPPDGELFLIFADRTTGSETYGGGRYLYAGPPDAAGRLTVDFNRAYNPPCVFTPYATCPLPPPQNRLALAVEAGEKNYAKTDYP